jgi:hypothetical protein
MLSLPSFRLQEVRLLPSPSQQQLVNRPLGEPSISLPRLLVNHSPPFPGLLNSNWRIVPLPSMLSLPSFRLHEVPLLPGLLLQEVSLLLALLLEEVRLLPSLVSRWAATGLLSSNWCTIFLVNYAPFPGRLSGYW